VRIPRIDLGRRRTRVAVGAVLVLAVAGGTGLALTDGHKDGDTGETAGGFTSSVRAPNDGSGDQLGGLALISLTRATAAATSAVPGVVTEVGLHAVSGNVVYLAEIAGSDRKRHLVVVDAGTGQVLRQQFSPETDDPGSG
jgi:uncharacterized membrane protein YkoI